MTDGTELLNRYVRSRSDPDFRALVDHYGGLVFGVAQRRLGNAELAKEATQNVFIILSKKAATIRNTHKLAGWLHRVAVGECSNLIRKERSHFNKMKQFGEEERAHMTTEPCSTTIADDAKPFLDEAIARLSQADRDAVMLRYYEGQTFGEIGVALGKSEEAIRKRIARALARMSIFLRHKGVRVSTVALGATLPSLLVHPLPTGYASIIAANTSGTVPVAATAMSAKLIAVGASLGLLAISIVGFQTGERSTRNAAPLGLQANSAPPVSFVPARPNQTISLEPLLVAANSETLRGMWDRAAKHHAELYIQSIPADRFEEAMRLIAQLDLRQDVAEKILASWASIDGETAMRHAQEYLSAAEFQGIAGTLLKQWSLRNGRAAWVWYRNRDLSLSSSHTVVEEIFSNWAEQAPEDAFMAIQELDRFKDADDRVSSLQGMFSGQLPQEQLIGYLDRLQEESDLAAAGSQLVSAWAKQSPMQAAAWVQTLDSDGALRARAEQELAIQWIQYDGAAAADWLHSNSVSPPSERMLMIVKHWAWRDPYAAGEWLSLQKLDATADRAIAEFVHHCQDFDVQSAFSWANSIHDPELRKTAIQDLPPLTSEP